MDIKRARYRSAVESRLAPSLNETRKAYIAALRIHDSVVIKRHIGCELDPADRVGMREPAGAGVLERRTRGARRLKVNINVRRNYELAGVHDPRAILQMEESDGRRNQRVHSALPR